MLQDVDLQYVNGVLTSGHPIASSAGLLAAIDPAAASIQPDGAQAAGASGLAASSTHVHPSTGGGMTRMGSVVGWTMPPHQATASTGALSGAQAGQLLMFALEIPVAATTSAINWYVNTAGNASPTNVFCALVNASGAIVAQTANRAADAVIAGGTGLWSPPWTSPFAAPAGEYWAALLIGADATLPSFISGTSRLNTLTNIGCTAGAGNLRAATFSSALSALPGSVTTASMVSYANTIWAALT
jgi:hypothetical protein